MPISACRVKIQRFRGIQDCTIVLPEHCLLLGRNNVGKSSIVEALALALGQDRVLNRVGDYDFIGGFLGEGDPLSKTFLIRVVLTGFGPDQLARWFTDRTAGPQRWWDPATQCLLEESDDSGAAQTATEIACFGHYEEDDCSFNIVRYFYRGQDDPREASHETVPRRFLGEIGTFLLPSRRTWDRTLTFQASSFWKLLREAGALPWEGIKQLREELAVIEPAASRDGDGPQEPSGFEAVVARVSERLRQFRLIPENAQIAYRPTGLDVQSLLASLIPHVDTEGQLLPLARQGTGILALQNLLLLVAFAERRRAAGRGFVCLLEEPELHLEPGLQRGITQLVRGYSTQTVATTHSPTVATAYPAKDVKVLAKKDGAITAEPLLGSGVGDRTKNLIEDYFYTNREAFTAALLGSVILVPEGYFDYEWLQRIQDLAGRFDAERTRGKEDWEFLYGLGILRTKDARVRQSLEELLRLNCTAVPVLDGDQEGREYARRCSELSTVQTILRWSDEAEMEDIVAWVLEPALLASPSEAGEVLNLTGDIDRESIAGCLKSRSSDRSAHEAVWPLASSDASSRERAWKLFSDLGTLATGSGGDLQLSWSKDAKIQRCQVLTL